MVTGNVPFFSEDTINVKTAMILAAGRGERLKPITDSCPKSLCKVGNEPLIVYHLNNLARAGIRDIVINHAWLGGKIRQYLGNGAAFNVNIQYSPEPPGGLETGGGIFQALPLLGDQPFVCVNADIYTDFDFSLLNSPRDNFEAHLVLVNNPQHNEKGDFGLSARGIVQNTPRKHTFSGIAVYSPGAFKHKHIGRYSVTPMIRTSVVSEKVSGEIYEGLWIDIGCMDRLREANQHALYSGLHFA